MAIVAEPWARRLPVDRALSHLTLLLPLIDDLQTRSVLTEIDRRVLPGVPLLWVAATHERRDGGTTCHRIAFTDRKSSNLQALAPQRGRRCTKGLANELHALRVAFRVLEHLFPDVRF